MTRRNENTSEIWLNQNYTKIHNGFLNILWTEEALLRYMEQSILIIAEFEQKKIRMHIPKSSYIHMFLMFAAILMNSRL